MTEMPPPACRRCGGAEDLMDVAMMPGMTYCSPCRVKLAAAARAADNTDNRAVWLDGYEFALTHLNDEAVQADLNRLRLPAESDAVDPAAEDSPTGSALAPGRESGGT